REPAMRRPTEYAGLAICAATYGALLAWPLYAAGPPSDLGSAAAAGVISGLCALAWVTAEAVWRARPWAYAAGLALAVGTVGTLVAAAALGAAQGELGGAVATLLMAGCVTLVVWPMVAYLRRTAAQPPRRPVLRPRP
ncbi:MAG TPA: hypothetical protein VF771_02875, partial [Longimicrobiaceae bacterium]